MNNIFSHQLVKLRRQSFLSQNELADKLYVSRQAISKWEKGESEPDIDKLIRLSEVFNVELGFLISGNSSLKSKIVSINKVSKSFSAPVLQNIDFDIYGRERIALLGANGAGKSTLIKLILGEDVPDSGSVKLNINPKKELSVMEQKSNLIETFTVEEQIKLIATMMNVYSQDKLVSWLEKFNLKAQSKTLIKNLSGGQKQRLALLISLIRPSKLLILDEPTAGMDLESIDLFWRYLDFVSGSVLTVTHDFNQIDKYFSRVLLLKNGKIQFDMSVDAIHGHNQTIEQWYRQTNKES